MFDISEVKRLEQGDEKETCSEYAMFKTITRFIFGLFCKLFIRSYEVAREIKINDIRL